MTQPTSVLLFAAGLGTRMAPLTRERPKPMIPVNGMPLLQHALDRCDGLRQVVNVHYFADQIRTYLAQSDIAISDETDLLRDTGGGLKHALPLLNSNPTFTMNTDAVWRGSSPMDTLLSAWKPDEMEALLLLIPIAQAVAHEGSGDFDLDDAGRLTRGSGYVYSGVQIIRTDRLTDIAQDAFSMWALWRGMLERGTMFGTVYDGQWCDVGRPDCIPIAETLLRGEHDV